jgi:hypothetical protein
MNSNDPSSMKILVANYMLKWDRCRDGRTDELNELTVGRTTDEVEGVTTYGGL